MIPKIIHQIWIGAEAPTYIKEAMETVKDSHPEYEYILHDNSALCKYQLDHLFDTTPEAFISNIMRVHILNEYGGYYIDADTISHGAITDLQIPAYSTFVTSLLDKGGTYKFQSALIASAKGYDFTSFLEMYEPTEPGIKYWDKFCHSQHPYEVPTDLFGRKSNVFEDLRIGSWYRDVD